MKLPKQDKYPKQIHYAGETYKIKFCKLPKDRGGDTNPEKRLIRINKDLTPLETFQTFVHEVLHLIEFETPIQIKHTQIYELENALVELFISNF